MDPMVRRYRFLVERVAVADAAAGHRRALRSMCGPDRAEVLRLVRDHLLVGTRVDASDVDALARFLVTAERRRPGVFVAVLPRHVVGALVSALEETAPAPALGDFAEWEPGASHPGPDDAVRHLHATWDRLEDDPVYQFMVDSQLAHASQPPKVRHTRRI